MLFYIDRNGNVKGFTLTGKYKLLINPIQLFDGKVSELITPPRSASQALKYIQKVLKTQEPLVGAYDWVAPDDPERTIHKRYIRVIPIKNDPQHVFVIQSDTQFKHLV